MNWVTDSLKRGEAAFNKTQEENRIKSEISKREASKFIAIREALIPYLQPAFEEITQILKDVENNFPTRPVVFYPILGMLNWHECSQNTFFAEAEYHFKKDYEYEYDKGEEYAYHHVWEVYAYEWKLQTDDELKFSIYLTKKDQDILIEVFDKMYNLTHIFYRASSVKDFIAKYIESYYSQHGKKVIKQGIVITQIRSQGKDFR